MSNGKNLTFYNLFDHVDFIEIPILQRDYAQGRSEETEVRALFLRSLFNALSIEDNPTRQSLDLDFVYGNYEDTENKVFSILDGQQRLTTLFLLHWYLAAENDLLADFKRHFVTPEGQSRFTYKTRPSTTEFFNALMVENFVIGNSKISEKISDSQWFYLSWKQDPTVQACLCMLDAIQVMFEGKASGLFKKLLDTDKPYITFQFLNLHSFGLSDELYIKMNARGKPLTVFENFKAKLEQFIQSYDQPWPPYQLAFKDGDVDGHEYFIHKIDTDWADLFWPYRNVCTEDNTFDDELMNLFRLIIAYQYLLDSRESPASLAKATSELFAKAGRLKEISLSKYEELNCFNQGLIVRFIEMIDLIHRGGVANNEIQPYLKDSCYYSEGKNFKKIIDNSASYDDKLRFFAFYSYLAKNRGLDALNSWMRVIYNLVENTITDSTSDFYRALFVISDLCQANDSILEALKSDYKISVFTPAQVLEEKIKAHLILRSEDWRDLILKAERDGSFDGQVGCILHFSGILDFYREYNNCNWDDARDSKYLENFGQYYYALAKVFNTIGNSSSSIDYAWERAVLSKGVYCTTTASGDRLNLLSSRDTRNNIPRDHSWRRLLRIGSEAIENKQLFVKEVLDDPLFDANRLSESLGEICDKALNGEELDSWRYELIKHKELISYCSQGFISHSPSETILLSQSQRNHYHCELFTKSLAIELLASISNLLPFTSVHYDQVKSRDEYPGITISGCSLGGRRYYITVFKGQRKFNVQFRGKEHHDFSQELKGVLEVNQFVCKERDDMPIYFFQSFEGDIQQIEICIVDLCSSLRGLANE